MAIIMQNALQHHDGIKYNLLAWCIMPNHVHVLIKANNDLSRIIQSWKSFTGRWALANNERLRLGFPKEKNNFGGQSRGIGLSEMRIISIIRLGI